MSITKFDCQFYRGDRATLETSSYIALNPSGTPGSLVVGCSLAARKSISSQVACKLALEHFVNGVLGFFEGEHLIGEDELSLEVLEAAFRNANTSVYQFGHKLAAGGRMAASLLGLVLQDSVIAAGRVGQGDALLVRHGEVFPFFESALSDTDAGDLGDERLIGAHSMVSVELAAVPVEPGDLVIAVSGKIGPKFSAWVASNAKSLLQGGTGLDKMIAQLVRPALFPDPHTLPFLMLASVGPETIYLAEVLS